MQYINYRGENQELTQLGVRYAALQEAIVACMEARQALSTPESLHSNAQHWERRRATDINLAGLELDLCEISCASHRLAYHVEQSLVVMAVKNLEEQVASTRTQFTGCNRHVNHLEPIARVNIHMAEALLEHTRIEMRYLCPLDQSQIFAEDNRLNRLHKEVFTRAVPSLTITGREPVSPSMIPMIGMDRLTALGIAEMPHLTKLAALCREVTEALEQARRHERVVKTARGALNEPQHQRAFENAINDAERDRARSKQRPRRIEAGIASLNLTVALTHLNESWEWMRRNLLSAPGHATYGKPLECDSANTPGNLLLAVSRNNYLHAVLVADHVRHCLTEIQRTSADCGYDLLCFDAIRDVVAGRNGAEESTNRYHLALARIHHDIGDLRHRRRSARNV